MKKILFFLLLYIVSLAADIPPGYYDGTEGLNGEALKEVLHDIIDGHIQYSYDDLRDFILPDTDEDPNNTDNVIMIYTGWSIPKEYFGAGVSNWNREHVWAKSHGNFGTTPGAGTDAHHIRPEDDSVNSARGNLDFDNGGTEYIDGDGPTGCFRDSDSWEPRDAVKGDVARMIFYMAVRYNGGTEIDLEMVDYIPSSPNNQPFHAKKSVLLEWHENDPPDDWEISRNDKVYNWQQNRNPFIDHPEFVAYIWNNTCADFSAEPTSGIAPLNVQFTDTSTASGEIVDWSWDFDGDGSEDSNLQNPSFTYEFDGVYDVSLTIEDQFGTFDTMLKNNYILVGAANIPVVILAESFEQPPDWIIYNAASTNIWTRTDEVSNNSYPSSVPDGSWYMYMNNYQSNEPGDDWLISPQIDLTDFSDVLLTFSTWTKFTESIPGLQVVASVDYAGSGDPCLANWTLIPANLPAMNSAIWTDSGEISLADYNQSSSLSLAFHYTSTGTSSSTCVAWAVDAVSLMGLENSSVVNEMISPEIYLSNYPNPFNPSTTISFETTNLHEFTQIEIYNLKGQIVKVLPVTLSAVEGSQVNYAPRPSSFDFAQDDGRKMTRAGSNKYSVIWNGTDNNNLPVSSGIYFYKLNISNSPVGKMLLLK
ncbi:MAG: endonuclease [Candidatus Cloacimonadales bacterium]|nr:endonuclease [Candidatus Cloacimonadales bacterium]